MRTVTIIRREWMNGRDKGRHYRSLSDYIWQTRNGELRDFSPNIGDYITVPLMSTYGTTKVRDMIPVEQITELAIFANSLRKGK